MRRLGLPEGRTYQGFRADAARQLGEDLVAEFDNRWERSRSHAEPGGVGEVWRWAAQDPEWARVLYGGWYSAALRVQCEWLAPRLAQRLDGSSQPLLVEAGAGVGLAAAVLAAAIKVPVLAVDPLPGSGACAAALAERAGASVEWHEAPVADLESILDGREPSAVYVVGTLRHLQGHAHRERSGYSYVAAIDRARAMVGGPAPDLAALLAAAGGADVLAAEVTCPDWLGELDGAAAALGYRLQVEDPGVIQTVVTGDVQQMATFSLRRGAPEPTSSMLLAGAAGTRTPAGRCLVGPAAEVARLQQADVSLLAASEVVFPDASLRIEAGESVGRRWVYQSSQLGYREMRWVASARTAQDELQSVVAEFEAAGARALPLREPAHNWR